MQSIPAEVRDFLSTDDSLLRAQLFQHFPDLNQTLNDPSTRNAVLAWLAGSESWDEKMTHFTMNCLKYLRAKATASESQIVRSFLLHPDPHVRLAAYEHLLTLYYPDKNREALVQLLQNMFSDSDEALRVEAAGYAKQSGVGAELKNFLLQWRKLAEAKGLGFMPSTELVDQLLNE
jgi:hypothetical protein